MAGREENLSRIVVDLRHADKARGRGSGGGEAPRARRTSVRPPYSGGSRTFEGISGATPAEGDARAARRALVVDPDAQLEAAWDRRADETGPERRLAPVVRAAAVTGGAGAEVDHAMPVADRAPAGGTRRVVIGVEQRGAPDAALQLDRHAVP